MLSREVRKLKYAVGILFLLSASLFAIAEADGGKNSPSKSHDKPGGPTQPASPKAQPPPVRATDNSTPTEDSFTPDTPLQVPTIITPMPTFTPIPWPTSTPRPVIITARPPSTGSAGLLPSR